jgi:hypothetical protein
LPPEIRPSVGEEFQKRRRDLMPWTVSVTGSQTSAAAMRSFASLVSQTATRVRVMAIELSNNGAKGAPCPIG